MQIKEIVSNNNKVTESGNEVEARTISNVTFEIGFSHDANFEEAFKQLIEDAEFNRLLEKELELSVKKAIAARLNHSTIPLGYGWTDDFSIQVVSSSSRCSINATDL